MNEVPLKLYLVAGDPEAEQVLLRVLRRAMLRAQVVNLLAARRDSVELEERGRCLVLVDCDDCGGKPFEVVQALRQRLPAHARIVSFTSSEDPRDVQESYKAGACTVIRKPGDLLCYPQTLEEVLRYWMTVNEWVQPDGEA
jgi:DNA-binding NarL/FixJ family response regulator